MIDFVRCIPCGSGNIRMEIRTPQAAPDSEPQLRFIHVSCDGCGRTATVRNVKGHIIEEICMTGALGVLAPLIGASV